MAFRAKAVDLSFDANKRYFWAILNLGNGIMHYGYVSADTPGAVEISGYFNDDELEFSLKAGDRLTFWQVDAISDTRTIQADLDAGLNSIYETIVMARDGAGIQVAPFTEDLSLEYTLP